jgi:hypothetical protein
MKRRGRRRLPKVRGRYDRGSGVSHFPPTAGLPAMRVMDGGRDAPAKPLTTRGRIFFGAFLAFAFVVLLLVLVFAT